jgi:hypothetical protein
LSLECPISAPSDSVSLKASLVCHGDGVGELLSTWNKSLWYVKCPCLSTLEGSGSKLGQNLVHVVVECPLCIYR